MEHVVQRLRAGQYHVRSGNVIGIFVIRKQNSHKWVVINPQGGRIYITSTLRDAKLHIDDLMNRKAGS